MAGGPDEPSQFASNRGQRLRRADARTELPIAVCKRSCARQARSTISRGRSAWRCLSVPPTRGAWRAWCAASPKHVSQQAVARFGDGAPMLLAATGRLGRHHAGVRHQLGCGAEAAQIASFRHDRHRAEKANAAKGLQRANDGHLAGALGALEQCGFQPFDRARQPRSLRPDSQQRRAGPGPARSGVAAATRSERTDQLRTPTGESRPWRSRNLLKRCLARS